MANIDKELSQIRNAIYGREVRGSIHDGIKKINSETEVATGDAYAAKKQVANIQEQVNNMVVEGDSSVEAAQARVDKDNHNYGSLKERLDSEQENVMSQLADITTSVKTFGMDLTAIQSAMAVSDKLLFSKGDYILPSKWVIDKPMEIIFQKGARLVPAERFSDDHAVEITSSNVVVNRIQMDGSNLPIETIPYDGTKKPRGVGIKVTGTPEEKLEGIEFRKGKIENTPFSAIFAEHCIDPIIDDNLKTVNCSHNKEADSPAVITISHCDSPLVSKVRNRKPGMKGISFSNCTDVGLYLCSTVKGNEGHAAYYFSNCTGGSISNNFAKDGFGIKFSRGNKGFSVNGNKFDNVPTGVFIQGSSDITVSGNTLLNPKGDAFQVDVHPLYGFGVSNILLFGNIIKNNGDRTSTTQSGLRVLSSENLPVEKVIFDNNVIEGMAYGARTVNIASMNYDQVAFTNNKMKDIRQTGIINHSKNLKVNGNEIENVDTNDGILIAGHSNNDGAIEVLNNILKNISSIGISIRTTVKANNLKVNFNSIDGVNIPISMEANTIPTISFVGNNLYNGSNNNHLILNGTIGTKQRVTITNNYLPDGKLTFVNGTDFNGVEDNNKYLTISSRPMLKPYRGTTANKPSNQEVGTQYFNIQTGKMLIYNGVNWIDGNGDVV